MRTVKSLVLTGSIALTMTACGKKGALVYPEMLLPTAPTVVSAIQSGSGVKMQFDLPESDRTGNRLNNLSGLKISKRESDSVSERGCGICMDDYRLFRTIYLDLLPDGVERSGRRLVVLDGDVDVGKRYSYFVVPFTRDGVDGASSSRVEMQVAKAVMPPILRVESYPVEIKLSFDCQVPDGSMVVGYNLYRSTQSNTFSYMPINLVPLKGKEYADSGLARGVKYNYFSRAVVRMPSGDLLESLPSNEVEGKLKDDE